MSKFPYRLFASALVVLVSLLVIGAVTAAPKEGLTASVSVSQGAFRSSQDVTVSVTLSNPTKHAISILGWFAVATLEEPVFTVTRDGQPVAYTGAYYKRPAPTAGDYLTIAPGASVTRSVNLGEFYDLSQSGRYEVAYRVAAHGLLGDKNGGSSRRERLESRAITFKVDGRAAKGKPGTSTPGFTACSTTQVTQLTTARADAKNYATNASSYLNAGTAGARYTTWFGTVTASRYATVKGNFASISSAMNTAAITFDCSSKQNVYAYVYPNRPYTIYLGRVYWSAPATGTDSKAGTLIHEMSHFDAVAGTDDVVYGQAGAKNLAISDPGAAITNADSHEYFAENTPFQP